MPSASMREVGQRIATIRRARRMTQAELARAAFVSLATVKAIERGARAPSDDTLDSLSGALSVDPSHIVTGSTRTDSRVHAAIPAISAAIAAYDIPTDAELCSLHELAQAADTLVQWRLGAQYARIAERAPKLLADTLTALHHTSGADRLRAAHLLAVAARSADAVAYKYGHRDLSARLVELMRWAADQTDDRIAQATAAYVRTETFFAARAHTQGLAALERAIDASPSPLGRAATAARGALHMRAAVIAGRAGDADAAALHLADARRLGDTLTEGAYNGTAFGPDSVRAHEVSVAISLGRDHVQRALNVAEEWTPPESLPAERQSGFWIELARAQVWAASPDDAFESLKVARHIAPQHTREHPWAREAAATVRRLKRADAESLTSFADWIGAI
ncbi:MULTISPECIES: helix-turn-helix domain-containing protein [Streptomyces]|uniref:Putative transcriptional regulator n=1 Tax=Streptomyces chartreusis NRRL 3882 TaxID=1079985 RepID=A0A2N9BB67_STRCX|nr:MULTISPECIES: helix-turn-helix transcriptional regulator [Streptomyces]MYS91461.1 helix-turn-helix domain-containing protein [Streptomyces sp. SID5464]SOR80574.1 putative transcriptional regulator [Streptomyces chartreusis NRRL 3882]